MEKNGGRKSLFLKKRTKKKRVEKIPQEKLNYKLGVK